MKRVLHQLTTKSIERVNEHPAYRAVCSCGWEGSDLHEQEEFAEHEGIAVHLPTVPLHSLRR